MSRNFGFDVLAERLSAPVTAAFVFCAIRSSTSRTTLPTTIRAVALLASGMTWLRLSSVPTRCTSGSTASSSSGSSSNCAKPSRSIASFCITCTTVLGKYVRISPSHLATDGADAPNPAERRRPLVGPDES